MTGQRFEISAAQAEMTLAAFLRSQLPGQSWNQVRRLIESRRARVAGDLCLDPARRLHAGESVELLARALPARPTPQTTVEAVMYSVRERGLAALNEPATKERLGRCDAAAWAQINRRIEKLIAAGRPASRGGKQ